MAATSGKVHWPSEGRQAEGAAILSADRFLLALTDQAQLLIFAREDTTIRALKNCHVAASPLGRIRFYGIKHFDQR